MLVRQVRLLTAVSRAVVVVGPSASSERLGTVIRSLAPTDVSVIPDQLPGRGPLGGIYTGLLHTRTEFSLFLGCDLPFMEDRFLRYLSERAIACGADATVPESVEHRLQPLAAVYRRRALGATRPAARDNTGLTLCTPSSYNSPLFRLSLPGPMVCSSWSSSLTGARCGQPSTRARWPGRWAAHCPRWSPGSRANSRWRAPRPDTQPWHRSRCAKAGPPQGAGPALLRA